VTFGCQANLADSERVAADMEARGYVLTESIEDADKVIINTCMVRQMAEDRVYGLYNNLIKQKKKFGKPKKIIITGCMVGAAIRSPAKEYFVRLRERMPQVDEWLPIEEVGFDHAPLRTDDTHAWVPISNGCNNFCTFCIVPFTRGREISRPFEEIIHECEHLVKNGYQAITLIGQNVNSYGADLILGIDNIQVSRDIDRMEFFKNNSFPFQIEIEKGHSKRQNNLPITNYKLKDLNIKPTYVKHLGRYRIPTLFPQLLETICSKFPKLTKIEFISSNPWDFSDDLIGVIAKFPQISRQIHLPVQVGSDRILKRMNRWYTAEQYRILTEKIRKAVPGVEFSTDIIVGFPGESGEDFEATLQLAKEVNFYKAYIARYSPRPHTAATKAFTDDVPHKVKKMRWKILDQLINKGDD
jgi:tRNA-2-methylthio-N6-dimethylallyladenosine synthase